MEKFIQFVVLVISLIAFYFIFDIFKFVIQYWYVFFILGISCLVYEFFTDSGSFARSGSASSSKDSIDGTYSVYTHGVDNNRVDRVYVNKDD